MPFTEEDQSHPLWATTKQGFGHPAPQSVSAVEPVDSEPTDPVPPEPSRSWPSDPDFPWSWADLKLQTLDRLLSELAAGSLSARTALTAAVYDSVLLYDEAMHRGAFRALLSSAGQIIRGTELGPDDVAMRTLAASCNAAEAIPGPFWKRGFGLRRGFLRAGLLLEARLAVLHGLPVLQGQDSMQVLESLARTANALVLGQPGFLPPLGWEQPICLKIRAVLGEIRHAFGPEVTSCLELPSRDLMLEQNEFVSEAALLGMVERAAGHWAGGRRDEIVKMSQIFQDKRQIGWHHRMTTPSSQTPLNPIQYLELCLAQVGSSLAVDGVLASEQLETVSELFRLDHNRMMQWLPDPAGLAQAQFTKFVLDLCCRGVDTDVFESGLRQLLELSDGLRLADDSALYAQEAVVMDEQRAQLDRWATQRAFTDSAAHRAAGDRASRERAREPSAAVAEGINRLKAGGTRMLAIAVESTLCDAPEHSQSVAAFCETVCPVLNQVVVAAVRAGVQVALVSKCYSGRTVQTVADSLFTPPDGSNILVRCGGVREGLSKALPEDPGGHTPSEKLFTGSGAAVIVPGHARKHTNFKQWNIESAVAAVKARGIPIAKQECLVIDASQQDVDGLTRLGYRAELWEAGCPSLAF